MYDNLQAMQGYGNYIWIWAIVSYVIWAIPMYKTGQKANVRKPWVAFIPVLQYIVFLHIIDKSGWAILLFLVPGLNIVLHIIWLVKFYLAFSVSAGLIVLSIIIPVINIIMMFVVAFSAKHTYVKTNRFTA
jgi:Family of unknown function (DUF5684)